MEREDGSPYVSTGHLPPDDEVGRLLTEMYRDVSTVDEGDVSTVYPALARARRDQFGVGLASVDGRVMTIGDADVGFPIMSVAKPFVYALVCEGIGCEEARRLVGANATGLAFNAPEAVERSADGRTNPMVNPGAIATTSLVPGADAERRWQRVVAALSSFAGRPLTLDEEAYASASATNHRNRELTLLLAGRGRLEGDPTIALDLYTRQSCLTVTARDIAVMGATLADGGVNPVTGARVVGRDVCHVVLAAMITGGLYETSGDWLHDVGLPGKSGIGGGIVTVSPGKGGLGTFAPPLDSAGNSVKGCVVARRLSRALGLDLLASSPHVRVRG
jgi:glutaminase